MSNRVSLRLIKNTIDEVRPSETSIPHPEGDQDHIYLIEQYIQTHLVKNYSPATITREKRFLLSWFNEYGNGFRPLYTWEAMVPIEGRKRILSYLQLLVKSGISTATVRSYCGILKRYFEYVLNFPYLTNHNSNINIEDKYNRLAQPVLETDIPRHTCNEEKRGIPIDPSKLHEFYSIVKKYYVSNTSNNFTRARNYTLIVLAGESGLRIDELLNLNVSDLFFEDKKIQTTHAKGTKGSGKRSRVTIFTPLARDTVKYYLNNIRPHLIKEGKSSLLFITKKNNDLNYATVNIALKEMIDIANKKGLPIKDHFSFHWLRRLFATKFIEKFPNQLAVLVNLLGHTTPNTVHRYIKHSEAWMDKKISEMLEGKVKWPSNGL